MKSGKKILGYLAFLTLFTNSFASQEVFSVAIDSGNFGQTTEASIIGINGPGAHGYIPFTAGVPTSVLIDVLNKQNPVPFIMNIDGYNAIVVTPDYNMQSVSITPNDTAMPLISLITATMDYSFGSYVVNIKVASPQQMPADYNLQINLAANETVTYEGSTVIGGAGGNSGKIFTAQNGSAAAMSYTNSNGQTYTNIHIYTTPDGKAYTIPYITGVVVDKSSNNNYSINFPGLR